MITSRLIFRLFPGRFTVMNNAVITSWDMNCFVSSPCIPTLEQAALTEGTFRNVNQCFERKGGIHVKEMETAECPQNRFSLLALGRTILLSLPLRYV